MAESLTSSDKWNKKKNMPVAVFFPPCMAAVVAFIGGNNSK